MDPTSLPVIIHWVGVAELASRQRAQLDASAAQVEALRSRTVWVLVGCTALAPSRPQS